MARTIRLSGSSGGGSGLSTSDVTNLIASNTRFVLDKKYEFTSPPEAQFPVIPQVDFDNVEAYRIVGKGLGGSANSNTYRYIHFGTANGQQSYMGHRGQQWYSGNQSYSNGHFNLSRGGQDTYGGGTNGFEMTIYINRTDAPNNARRVCNISYRTEIPIIGGYNGYQCDFEITVISNADWNDIKISDSANQWILSDYVKVPSFTVYKQLRVPAS